MIELVFGKGEVQSSNLCGGTIFFFDFSRNLRRFAKRLHLLAMFTSIQSDWIIAFHVATVQSWCNVKYRFVTDC